MLHIKNISKQYDRAGKTFAAVDNISLNMAEGDFISIIGRSGSGKTTLLNMVAGLLSPTGGDISFDGVNPFVLGDRAMARFRNCNIGYVPQGKSLLANLTALDNIRLPFYLAPRAGACLEKARALLNEMGLPYLAGSYPQSMSGGEMRRVAIARALINNPKLIIADEPTSDLDLETTHEIIALLKRLNATGTAILVVTHDLELARCGGQVFKMAGGRLEYPLKQR